MNDINKFMESSKYYLIDIFHGKAKISNINIQKKENSRYNLTNRKEVEITSKTKKIDPNTGEEVYTLSKIGGFIKCSENSYSDDLDIINQEIATLLGIPSSKIFRLVSEDNIKGTINISINDDAVQLNLELLMKESIKIAKANRNLDITWLKKYAMLPITDADTPINNVEQINDLIMTTIEAIKHNFRLTDIEEKKIIKGYILMLLLDYITGQEYRDFKDYSILVDKEKHVMFAPVYDFNNTLTNKDIIRLNNKYISKEALIATLFNKYYDYFKGIARGLNENIDSYKKSIKLIIDNNTSSKYQEIITNNIFSNLDNLMDLENEKRLNFGESRIDMVLTQTSINLNAVNRNQEIRNKYELVDPNKNSLREIEDKMLKITEKPKEKKKISIGFIFGVIIGLLVLVGVVIFSIYFITNN